ncbi:hypothetical protein Clacol_010324 [Clathrus columnatus]|uniref:Ricin B lectin domain-containing protein n=1 Tax=Clathrus columnatus TaxID=1419009 RepID=A0AAV5AVX9_9AGAM|nr:hypothetical protein Clacol_010324 [Clathrus columnatus]
MSLNGIYNIVLNGGSLKANSAAVGTKPGVNLVAFNNNDDLQKWSVKPIGGAKVGNTYLIQNAYTGLYVAPYNNTLTFSPEPYVWITTGDRSRISTVDSLNWVPSDNDELVIVTENKRNWSILA